MKVDSASASSEITARTLITHVYRITAVLSGRHTETVKIVNVGVLSALVMTGLAGCVSQSPAAKALDQTATTIARNVDLAIANMSLGDYSEGGINYLTSNIENYRGEVLGSGGESILERDVLQSWVDARFEVSASGGFLGKEQAREIICLRFEVHSTYGDYTTYDEIDCP
jgi:hypothetical protein